MYQPGTLKGLREDQLKRIFSPTLLEIASLTSVETVVKLVNQFGGRRLYIAVHAERAKRLPRIIGKANTRALCERFGGRQIYVPSASEAMRILRDDEILRRRGEGATLSKLVEMFGLTERRICHILATRRARHETALLGR